MKGYPKLKALLVERGIKQRELAKMLGITSSTLNNKLNGSSDFSMREARVICDFLGISADIFLGRTFHE